jgi:protoporphyrinogen oxidase
MTLSVVVVGAGLSGLAAARRLEAGGAGVVVLEAGANPGGRVRTEQHGDYLVDTGPDAATDGYTRWLNLVSELGLDSKLVPSSPVAGVVRNGRVVDIDPRRKLRAAAASFLSWRGKLRVVGGVIRLRKELAAVDAFSPSDAWALDHPEESAHALAVRAFGREAADGVLDGLTRLVAGSGSRHVSRVSLVGALAAWTASLVNVEGGLAAVTDTAAASLTDLRCHATVERVDETGDGVRVSYRQHGTEHHIEADACVIAAMWSAARAIHPPLAELDPEFTATVRELKLVGVSLGYSRRPNSEAYAVLVPTAEDPDVLLIFLQHNKARDRAPAGHALITLYTDDVATERIAAWADEDVVAWASARIESLFPELQGHRDLATVVRWPEAGYLATPGSFRRSHHLAESFGTNSRVALAGDLFGAGSMESAVRGGEAAADRVLQTIGHGTGREQ